jgi:hypothetical protein
MRTGKKNTLGLIRGTYPIWEKVFEKEIQAGVTDTRMLVHPNYEGIDGDVLVDDAMGRHAIATNGVAQTFKEVFNNCVYFDGSGYITSADSADWDVVASTSEDWTIDFWFKSRGTLSALERIFEHYQNGSNYWAVQINNGKVEFVVASGGSTVVNVSGGPDITVRSRKWQHIALVKVGTTYGIYIDGVQVQYAVDASTVNFTGLLYIGRDPVAATNRTGWYDEIRIQKSNAFSASPQSDYSDVIEVPVAPYIADANTKLLLHFDEVAGTTTFIDSSPSAHTMTTAGTGTYAFDGKARSEIGDLVLAFPQNFNSTGDYFETPDHADFAFGSDDLTIEVWIKLHAFASTSNEQIVLAQYVNISNYWVLSHATLGTGERVVKFEVVSGGSTLVELSVRVSEEIGEVGTWHYVAVQRSGSTWGLFIDGLVCDITSYAGAFPDLAARVTIGRWDGASAWYFQGVMQGLRISNVARYDFSTFTVPSSEYTADGYDVLLMHMNGDVSDATGRHTPVNVGGVTFDGAVKKFGSASANFSGTLTDYITIPASIDFAFGQEDFTIDLWVYHDVTGNARAYMMQDDGVTSWALGRNSSGRYTFQLVYGGSNVVYLFSRKAYTYGVGTWVHVALVRKGIKWTIFVDGEPSVAQQSGAHVPYVDSTLYIGQYSTSANPFDGKIDEVRISKGIARWDNAFTPPSAPFTDGQVTHLIRVLGLDGDQDEMYLIRSFLVPATSAFPNRIDIQLNGDTDTNYGHQFIRAIDTTVDAARVTAFTGLQLNVATGSELSFGESLLFAKSGAVRTIVNQHTGGVIGTTVDRVVSLSEVWNNSDDVIRELWFLANNVNGIGVGSRVEVYRKGRVT